jgi:hypothetical protein
MEKSGGIMNVDKLMEANKRNAELERELEDNKITHSLMMKMEAARIACLVEEIRKLEWQLRNK